MLAVGGELHAEDSTRLEATADSGNEDAGLVSFLRWTSKDMSACDEAILRARLLSCPTRVNLWNALGPAGRHPMDLAREFGLAPSTVTYHLALLVRAKLAKVYGHGSSRVYTWSGTKLGIITAEELQEFTTWVATP